MRVSRSAAQVWPAVSRCCRGDACAPRSRASAAQRKMTRFDSTGARASAEAPRAIQLAERAVAARMAAQRAPARGRLGRSARKADGRAEGMG